MLWSLGFTSYNVSYLFPAVHASESHVRFGRVLIWCNTRGHSQIANYK